jgi:glyoxylase-like metal-dependent hydrolase (beta-lactamase superfamily II)/rhodanese-related sulfurtransferase
VIVDPSLELQQYDAVLADRGFTLRFVVDTHVHADHVSGARQLATAHGAALCLHESADVRYSYRALTDGEELALGTLRLKVIHTPGHRPEHISIVISNPARSPEPSMVLTGDCLLVGDVGRPDFGGGDAAKQFDSLSRLLRLPDWVGVFPGHFEGPCGRSLCGQPCSTIGFERLFNPMARLDRPAFEAALLADLPPRPLNMKAIERTNRGDADMSWAMLNQARRIDEVDVDDVAERDPSDTFLLDVREPDEFDRGFVPGAINIPQCELATRLDEVPRDRLVYAICHGGFRSYHAAQFLAQVGFARIVNVQGGTGAWFATGGEVFTREDGSTQAVCLDSSLSHATSVVESAWTG